MLLLRFSSSPLPSETGASASKPASAHRRTLACCPHLDNCHADILAQCCEDPARVEILLLTAHRSNRVAFFMDGAEGWQRTSRRRCRLEPGEETCAQVVILSKHARLTKPKAAAQTHVSGAFIAKYEILWPGCDGPSERCTFRLQHCRGQVSDKAVECRRPCYDNVRLSFKTCFGAKNNVKSPSSLSIAISLSSASLTVSLRGMQAILTTALPNPPRRDQFALGRRSWLKQCALCQ